MANYVKINSDGELEISGKVVRINELVYKTPDNRIVDIDGGDLLADNGDYVTTEELQTVSDRITNEESAVNAKADKTYVDDALAVRPVTDDVVLKTDLDVLRTAVPEVSGPTGVNEQSSADYTISNYNSDFVYEMSADAGTITDNGDGTFTYVAEDITDETDKVRTITVNATEVGKLKSETLSLTINVIYVAVTADGTISNSDYKTNSCYNTGFEF